MSPVKDKARDNIKFQSVVFVGSKLMPFTTCHSTIFSEGNKMAIVSILQNASL
jgi:hypothetical protein